MDISVHAVTFYVNVLVENELHILKCKVCIKPLNDNSAGFQESTQSVIRL